MAFCSIELGCKLDIKVQYRNMGEVVYVSKVLKILDADAFELAAYPPVRSGEFLEMLHDKEYDVTAYTDQSMIVFKAYFGGFLESDTVKAPKAPITLRFTNEGHKVQRREFFRFPCNISMSFSIVDYDEEDEAAKIFRELGLSEAVTYEGIIKDIGGGGMRFVSDKELGLENPIYCNFVLGSIAVSAKGRILEKQHLPKSNPSYQYRLLFLEIDKTAQEEIVNYIFAQQRNQRHAPGAEES